MRFLGIYFAFFFLLTSCTSSRTKDKTTLVSIIHPIPNKFKHKRTKVEKHIHHGNFPEISSEFSIHYETVHFDSLNSMIQSIKVVLDKGKDGCTFTAKSPKEQLNAETEKNLQTFTDVQIDYIKEGPFSTKQKN